MVSRGHQTRKHLRSRGHHVLVLAGALLLASGLTQPRAQTQGPSMGPSAGAVQEVDQGFANGLVNNPNVVFVPVIRKGAAPVIERVGKGHASDSGQYEPKADALEFSGACKDEAGCSQYDNQPYVTITGKVSTEALGVSPNNPITEVLPVLMIKVGHGTCWWSCSSPGGSSGCKCTCVGGGTCPQQ